LSLRAASIYRLSLPITVIELQNMSQRINKKSRASMPTVFVLALSIMSSAVVLAADSQHYRLGPEDQVSIRVVDLDKLQLDNASAPKIDVNGDLNLPIIGHLHAEGLTLDELKTAIAAKLGDILNNPSVSVSIVQYRNHPVSVLGAVRNPGVFQVAQSKHLLEVLSLAGGTTPEAGDKLKISRLKTSGPLPLPDVKDDEDAGYQVGTLDVHALIDGADTKLNILVEDGDVIAVTKAALVFIMGAVRKAGGFTLADRPTISVLQAISLAEGLDRTASPGNARLLREEKPGQQRTEIAINLKPILNGTAPDVPLRANDILFVPTSGVKVASFRGLEAAIQLGTGFAVFH
jgi:polysaccharide export outer membrane protein